MRNISKISLLGLTLSLITVSLFACAKRDDGSYDINLGTITESIRTGKLVVNENEGTDTFKRPAKPREGCILVVGKLESDEPYDCKTGRDFSSVMHEATFNRSRGLQFIEDGDDNWFFAEINKKTGEIQNASLSFNGDAGRGTEISGKLDQKLNGSLGRIDSTSYAISVSGQHESISPGFGHTEPNHLGVIGAVIMGKGDLLTAPDGTTFKGKLYLGVDSIPSKTPSKRNCDAFITFGTAPFRVIR